MNFKHLILSFKASLSLDNLEFLSFQKGNKNIFSARGIKLP